MTTASNHNQKLMKMIAVGLMAALVFVGNYLQIKIPVAIGDVTRVHLGNSMCLLAGLLFGPGIGGLASGIGAGLYDLLDPLYIISAPYTFCSKFAMGFLAGVLNRYLAGDERRYRPVGVVAAGVVGQLAYITLYLVKSYVSLRLIGTPAQTAFVAVLPKVGTSTANAVAAVVISVPLFFALRKALLHTGFYTILTQRRESKGYWNPVTAGLTVYCCVVTLVASLYLSSAGKIQEAQQEKEAAMAAELAQCQSQLSYLADQLDISLPQPEPEESSES